MDVKENKITLKEQMIGEFNFSEIRYMPGCNEGGQRRASNIIRSLKRFYRTYYPYRGATMSAYIRKHQLGSSN